MKRSITDFFGTSPNKKSKLTEEVAPANNKHVLHAPVASGPPQATPKASMPMDVDSSSNALTANELAQIETSRKKALALRLLQRITEPSWREVLAPEFEKPYMLNLADFLAKERTTQTIFPSDDNLFTALNLCPLGDITVVMLGQDPYHGPNQAHGLCFSVLPPTKPPSSLQNMFKELKSNYPEINIPKHGNLESWAKQGILMINTVLTVRSAQANSHAGKGWETFTDAIISAVSKKHRSLIFLLWGSHAQSKAKTADATRHILLKAPHPSGLSAHRGFFGCKHFSEVNTTLARIGRTPINWQLPLDGTVSKPAVAAAPAAASSSAPSSQDPKSQSSVASDATSATAPVEAESVSSSAPADPPTTSSSQEPTTLESSTKEAKENATVATSTETETAASGAVDVPEPNPAPADTKPSEVPTESPASVAVESK